MTATTEQIMDLIAKIKAQEERLPEAIERMRQREYAANPERIKNVIWVYDKERPE